MSDKIYKPETVLEHIIFLGNEYKQELSDIKTAEMLIFSSPISQNADKKLLTLSEQKRLKATLYIERIKDFLDGVQHE